MNANPKFSPVRPAGREHIPLLPNGFIALRIVQLVLAVLVLALAAYGCAVFPTSGNIYMLVVCLLTIGISTYYLVVHYQVPKSYNYWAVLGCDIFLIIMWLASFAVLASEAAVVLSYAGGYGYFYSSYAYDGLGVVGGCMAGASGLGGLQFVLFIVSLVLHSIALHRHRAAGLHCKPGVAPTVPAGGEKPQGQPQGQPQPAVVYPQGYPQPGFPQQAYPQAYPQQPQPHPYGQPPQAYPPQAYPHPQMHPQQPQPGQPQPQQMYYVQQQGQVPIPVQSTGGSYGQPQPQHYQQGPPVPLFTQTTGGSMSQQTPPPQQQQQVVPQPTAGSELENNQVPTLGQGEQQQRQQQ